MQINQTVTAITFSKKLAWELFFSVYQVSLDQTRRLSLLYKVYILVASGDKNYIIFFSRSQLDSMNVTSSGVNAAKPVPGRSFSTKLNLVYSSVCIKQFHMRMFLFDSYSCVTRAY